MEPFYLNSWKVLNFLFYVFSTFNQPWDTSRDFAHTSTFQGNPDHNHPKQDSKVYFLGCLYAYKDCNDPSIDYRITADKEIVKSDWF